MATFTVKNIPVDLYEELKRSAHLNHRSVNSEIIACIERAILSQPINPDLLLANARVLREKTASYVITDDEFSQIKNEGRE